MISIVRNDGNPVLLYPGGQGERDLVAAISAKVASKKVGILRTTATVQSAVEESIREVLHEIKAEVYPAQ